MRDGRFRWGVSCVVDLLLVVVSAGDLMGQVTTGTILAAVKDETGAPLPGVTLTLAYLETRATRTLLTDSSGAYRVSNLPLGPYEVRAELMGFQSAVRKGNELAVGREAVLDRLQAEQQQQLFWSFTPSSMGSWTPREDCRPSPAAPALGINT